jgi:hypothetical protein
MGSILAGVEKKAAGGGCRGATHPPYFFLYQVIALVESASSVFPVGHGSILIQELSANSYQPSAIAGSH